MSFIACEDCQTPAACARDHEQGSPVRCRQADHGLPLPIDRPIHQHSSIAAMPGAAAEEGDADGCTDCPSPARCSAIPDYARPCAAGNRQEIRFEAVRVEVSKLALQPGDVLVVSVPIEMDHQEKVKMAKNLGGMLPKQCRVLLKCESVKFDILSGAGTA